MANKRAKAKKPKQNKEKMSGRKGGSMSMEEMGSPTPARRSKK